MESVLPGGLGGGALDALGTGLPDLGGMAAPDKQTGQSPMTPPVGGGFGVPSF